MPNDYIKKMLGTQEKVLLVARQHWFVFLSSILLELAVTLVIVVLGAVASIALGPLAWIGVVVALVLLLVPFIGGTIDFLNWWNRQYLITNRRVIQIYGIFNKNVTDSSLEKVNDIMLEQSALGRLLNYGDVEILTASEMGANKFNFIAEPIAFKRAMLNAKEDLERGDWDIRPASQPNDVAGLIERLDYLRKQGILTEEEFQAKKSQLLLKM